MSRCIPCASPLSLFVCFVVFWFVWFWFTLSYYYYWVACLFSKEKQKACSYGCGGRWGISWRIRERENSNQNTLHEKYIFNNIKLILKLILPNSKMWQAFVMCVCNLGEALKKIQEFVAYSESSYKTTFITEITGIMFIMQFQCRISKRKVVQWSTPWTPYCQDMTLFSCTVFNTFQIIFLNMSDWKEFFGH